MTTWFAQNSSVNIDSVNQWNDAAGGGGNWLTWASLAVGDILVANGKTSITINVNVTCATITTAATGGTAGGGFIVTPGVTITAAVVAGTTNCLTLSSAGSTTTIVGNCTGGSATNTGYAVLHSSSGILNITGNLTAGTGTNSWAVNVSGTGQLNVTGNCTGGSSGTANRGLVISGAAIVSVTGNVIGSTGSGGQASGCHMTNGSLYVTGNVTAGTQGSGIEINGSVTLIVITGTIQSSTAHPAIYAGTNSAPVCHFGDIATVANARQIAGYITYRVHPTGVMVAQHRSYNTSTYADLGSRSLYTGGVNLNQPAVGNVRSGTTYGAASEYTGTLAVPSPTLVAIGVATDNTVGSYAPSGASAADVADAVWDEARSAHTTSGSFGATSQWVSSGDTSGVTELLTRIPDAAPGVEGGLPVLSADLTVLAELDSASRLAIWNTLTTETFTADSFGDLLLISDGTNGRAVKVTGANHVAADVHDCQTDGLSGSTEITNIQNASGYLLAVLAGACADPQTASETYAITVFGSTFTVDMAGQTSTGTRTAPTLTKA